MPREVGKTWERYGRRFNLRLSLKRPDEVAVMNEYDRRSELLGQDDKEFLKSCLIAGFRVLSNEGLPNNSVALSTNESNNNEKQQSGSASANESNNGAGEIRPEVSQRGPSAAEFPAAVITPAVPAKSVLGNLMQHK